MIRLKFDLSECLQSTLGIAPEQFNTDRDACCRIRDQICLESGARFLSFPKQLHQQYESERELSDLGRVFQIANGMHDEIDAVVVIGANRFTLGAKSLMQACCDPYHNELTRAARGSKPRMYFAGGDLDNDATSTLLNRISCGGYGETVAESRWGLVIVSDCQTQPDKDALKVADLFTRQFQDATDKKLNRLDQHVVLISRNPAELQEVMVRTTTAHIFQVPNDMHFGFEMLSPVGLLPAALLGLDCMKLLGGAHEMSQHFSNADFQDNVPLQYASLLHESYKRGKRHSLLNVRNHALKSFGSWCQCLMQREENPMFTYSTCECQFSHERKSSDSLVVDVRVQADRCDSVFSNVPQCDSDPLHLANPDRPPFEMEDLAATPPAAQLTLPHIGMFELGDWMQMWMIVTRVLAGLQSDGD